MRKSTRKMAEKLAAEAVSNGGKGTLRSGYSLLSNLVHGNTAHLLGDIKWGLGRRLLVGSPTWAKATVTGLVINGTGHLVNSLGGYNFEKP